VVQGETFQIQDGSVTFQRTEKPTNPTVVATATWDSPDRIRVFADYVGSVETGKLTLHSEPSLTNNEILSLLLFGSADGPVTTTTAGAKPEASGSIGTTALAASAGVISGGLNRALARLTTLDVQTRIGEHQGSPLPEVALQLTPRLSAELAYALNTPLPGQSPDRTFVTLDLRLFSNWSLTSTVGDQGSTLLDLLWRHRY
jgi:translocation and assembly module TamB